MAALLAYSRRRRAHIILAGEHFSRLISRGFYRARQFYFKLTTVPYILLNGFIFQTCLGIFQSVNFIFPNTINLISVAVDRS